MGDFLTTSTCETWFENPPKLFFHRPCPSYYFHEPLAFAPCRTTQIRIRGSIMLHSMKMMRLRMGYYALFLGGVGSSEEFGLPLTWALLLRDADWSKWLTSQMDLHKWCWQHNSYTPTHPNKLSLQSQWPILHIQHGSHLSYRIPETIHHTSKIWDLRSTDFSRWLCWSKHPVRYISFLKSTDIKVSIVANILCI